MNGLPHLIQSELQKYFLPALRRRFKDEVNRLTKGGMEALLGETATAQDQAFVLSYLHALHWLQANVPKQYWQPLLAPFSNGPRGFLMDLLIRSKDAETFIHNYIEHWLTVSVAANAPIQRTQILRLFDLQQHDRKRLAQLFLQTWNQLNLFTEPPAKQYQRIAHQERNRYRELSEALDQQRLALIDALSIPVTPTFQFTKLGLVPTMGCRHSCRHCMFIWRPPINKMTDIDSALKIIACHTTNLLFTGGDLTKHLDLFYRAIKTLKRIRTFAILLNGDFAIDLATTHKVLQAMTAATEARPAHWPSAHILLQISFDEMHQEILVNRTGLLQERIPVARIANIVEIAPQYQKLKLCLLHKQNTLNFSMDVLQKGVFARLTQELYSRGYQIKILSTTAASRSKPHPLDATKRGPVLKDANFILTKYPHYPILFTSSTIDGYGRAALLEIGETINERELLTQMLANPTSVDTIFDTDLMFWANGWVTLFAATHICLGNWRTEDSNTILTRYHKDPLTEALRNFNQDLLCYYSEIRDDLDARIAVATSPQHLFHMLTEKAEVRLHMTKRLLDI
ncbi:hypothetical protein TI03_02460 [Achromatium sp. WMS1]|nr:hypothetical protein TI03_02460 [Achromatium sp. WMS1]